MSDGYTIHPATTGRPESIACHACGLRSYHPKDVAERYYGFCHKFHDGPPPPPGAHPVGCELCGDQAPLLLRPRCHLTAPLKAAIDGDVLVLSCYLPECGREVARFRVVRPGPGGPPP